MNNKKILTIALMIISVVAIFVIFYYYLRSTTTISVSTQPSDTDIVINNIIYKSPLKTKFKPGKYTIWAFKENYEAFKEDYNVKIARDNVINITLTALDHSKEPPEGAPLGPKIENLPYQNDHFRVDWDSALSKYLIVPNIPFTALDSPENQFRQYWQQYEQYAKEALLWIKSQGVTPTEDNIEWWGKEWWPEGKNISNNKTLYFTSNDFLYSLNIE